MSSMQDDIDKYSKIWDAALQKGIFDDVAKNTADNADAPDTSTDFFGQYSSEESGKNKPLNEVDSEYWLRLSNKANPLFNSTLDVKKESTSADSKRSTKAIANAHNPIRPTTVGEDGAVNVTQNWAMGGEAIEKLEKLKEKFNKLENELSALLSKEDSVKKGSEEKDAMSKIESLRKEIDTLSNSLSGGRFSAGNEKKSKKSNI